MRLLLLFETYFDDLEGKELLWTTVARFEAFAGPDVDATFDAREGKELISTTVTRFSAFAWSGFDATWDDL